ncbi:MAG: cobalt transporter [Alphaproteobacteria bacterium]|nr:cobalt transporter [Alphaproteobacteria bacterium]
MVVRLFWIALAAGLVAGLVAAGVQAIGTWPLIDTAETFEIPDPVAAHEWSPEGLARAGWSVLFDILAGVGFALLANGALLVFRSLRTVALDWRVGAILGALGFATFALAPAFGLAPALPGMAEGDLVARQTWWLATAAATLSGGVLSVLGRRTSDWLIGIALIAAPHVVGAPGEGFGLIGLLSLDGTVGEGGMPVGLAQRFAIVSLAAAAIFWAALGFSSAWLQRRYLELR